MATKPINLKSVTTLEQLLCPKLWTSSRRIKLEDALLLEQELILVCTDLASSKSIDKIKKKLYSSSKSESISEIIRQTFMSDGLFTSYPWFKNLYDIYNNVGLTHPIWFYKKYVYQHEKDFIVNYFAKENDQKGVQFFSSLIDLPDWNKLE